MGMVALLQPIASAYLVYCGVHGDVQRHARARQVTRQRIYREAAWLTGQLDDQGHLQEINRLQRRVAELEQRNQQFAEQLARAVVLDSDKQMELATVAHAMGVTLPTIHELLEVLLPGQAPSVAALGRWTKAAGEKSAALLQVLDEFTQERVREAVADEIFVNDPVLMVVEPASLCWTTGRRLGRKELNGDVWAAALAEYPKLEAITMDAGMHLQGGLKKINARRRTAGQAEVLGRLDHFHSLWHGSRCVGGEESRLRGVMNEAWRLERKLRENQRRGRHCQAVAVQTRAKWPKAEKMLEEFCQQKALWEKVKEALPLVTPEGDLNTRQRAEAILAETLPRLSERFGRSKRLLRQARTLAYLDRVHQQLEALPVPAELRQAAVRQETLRRRPELLHGDSTQAGALRGLLLLSGVILSKAENVGRQAAEGVQRIFRNAWRASSLVECINSVLRMQQARHRKMPQGMINLKRLYWNSHLFRTGRRRGKSPYELLGVPWPEGVRWWDLLQWSPERLRGKLSAPKEAA